MRNMEEVVIRSEPGWHAGLWQRLVSASAKIRLALPSRPVRRLRVQETLALGDKRQLLIVECGDRQLLIGAAGNFLTTLAELPAVIETGDKA